MAIELIRGEGFMIEGDRLREMGFPVSDNPQSVYGTIKVEGKSATVMLTPGEGITLHVHICEDCKEEKPCFEGTRQADGASTTFYRCPSCDSELVKRYEASLKTE